MSRCNERTMEVMYTEPIEADSHFRWGIGKLDCRQKSRFTS